MVPGDGALHGVEQLGAPLVVASGLGVLVQRDPGPVGEEAHGVDEVEVVHGAHEGDGVARRVAAEAVVEALLGVDAERGRLLGVEGAQATPAPAHLLQRGVLADQATMSVAARTCATSSSGIPTARRYRGAVIARPAIRSVDGCHHLRRLRPDLHDGHVRPRGARPGVHLGLRTRLRLSSSYGFLSGAWPFGVVEAIWTSSRSAATSSPAAPAPPRLVGWPWPAQLRRSPAGAASTAWAAARRATGTRNGEQLT